jgi:hypothetical protein
VFSNGLVNGSGLPAFWLFCRANLAFPFLFGIACQSAEKYVSWLTYLCGADRALVRKVSRIDVSNENRSESAKYPAQYAIPLLRGLRRIFALTINRFGAVVRESTQAHPMLGRRLSSDEETSAVPLIGSDGPGGLRRGCFAGCMRGASALVVRPIALSRCVSD